MLEILVGAGGSTDPAVSCPMLETDCTIDYRIGSSTRDLGSGLYIRLLSSDPDIRKAVGSAS